ncbi:type II toxin-antitoxin system RatA family toxin [Kushneria marisflavi]|uniref:Ubiquinone-binding protein n=1 Tax=Kushneria marisflavi TaxID=157779 RepID=A0A240UR80_9GAMM|nr:type II toxin-antitoxin system RatA family toxin [Kushneria marisflavi]ART63530.1 ubiquinone-binding protein [Kushneria marisflavi]RKD75842.1 ribosome-associated toxin RatA of RatAB toxin-antitoxin module [Kushneria marisflavi]
MPTVDRSAMVRHTDQQMFDLVNDFERYPEFLPNCRNARTVEREEDHLVGELTLGKGGIEQTFRTHNALKPFDRIDLSLASGPFKRFEGYWKFVALDDRSCRVELHLEFEFSSRLLGMAFGRLFNQLAGQLVDAFIERADKVYGR